MTALADIDPDHIGITAANLAHDLAVKLSQRMHPTIRRLCLYAQTGATWQRDIAADFAFAASALLSSPARPWRPQDLASLTIGHGPAESDLLHVLGCVHARLKIERGEAVSVAELAALASITRQRAYQLSRKGEIAATGGRGATASTVTATEARRWLAARGLKGWEV